MSNCIIDLQYLVHVRDNCVRCLFRYLSHLTAVKQYQYYIFSWSIKIWALIFMCPKAVTDLKNSLYSTLINNNTAPFVSIIWHHKEPLGCVIYSHCPLMTLQQMYTLLLLTLHYVTKPFGISQRIIKSQKVCLSFVHSESQSFFSQKNLWLNVQTCF